MDERGSAVLLIITIFSALWAFGRVPQAVAQQLPGYLNTEPGVRYVGSKACASCHPDIHAEYLGTAMGRSMALAGANSLPVPVSPVIISDDMLGRKFEIFRSGPNLYQSESETAPDGVVVFNDTRRIAYAIGAGENGIGYLAERQGYLLEAPLSYYSQTHTWALSPSYEVADLGFDRPAALACLACHSGRPQPVPGRDGQYEAQPFKELSIGCEDCHGPGQLHVEERTEGTPLKGAIDHSIVNPADLAPWLANDICMRCHESGDAQVLEPGKTYLDFRPGQPLSRTVAIFAVPFTAKSPPQSPLLQQYVQMVLSKCYRASGGRLSCITCHDPHVEPTRSQAPGYFRKKCLQCHTLKSCGVPLAARLRQSPPDNCIGCHMPRQNLKTISHSALTNHRIIASAGESFPESAFHMTTSRVPDLVFLDPDRRASGARLNPLVLLQAYRNLAGAHPEYRASETKLLDELAQSQPHNPLVLSALGQRALLAGRYSEAHTDLAAAISAGSDAASDLDLYARLLIQAGSMADAVPVLERDIALHPYSTERYKMLAFAYIKLQKYRHALQTMHDELDLFPQDSDMRALIARVQSSFSASPQ